jgi:hypothetical protein
MPLGDWVLRWRPMTATQAAKGWRFARQAEVAIGRCSRAMLSSSPGCGGLAHPPEGDASVPTLPRVRPRPYGYGGPCAVQEKPTGESGDGSVTLALGTICDPSEPVRPEPQVSIGVSARVPHSAQEP